MFPLTAANGRVRLTPRASLYGGSIAGEIRIDVREGADADFGLVQNLANVDLLSLGRDYLDTEAITGTGNVNLDLRARGSNMGQLMRELDGDVSFTLSDGAWEGIDAWYELRRARAVASGNPAPAREGARRTPFSSVSATGVIENALLTNRDLNASLGFMSIDGAGTVNLLTNEMNFEVTAQFIDGEMLQSDPAMASLAGARLPLTVGGTLDAPSIRPQFGSMVREAAREAVDEAVEEERNEAEERLEEQRDEARDRLRDRLRGILDR